MNHDRRRPPGHPGFFTPIEEPAQVELEQRAEGRGLAADEATASSPPPAGRPRWPPVRGRTSLRRWPTAGTARLTQHARTAGPRWTPPGPCCSSAEPSPPSESPTAPTAWSPRQRPASRRSPAAHRDRGAWRRLWGVLAHRGPAGLQSGRGAPGAPSAPDDAPAPAPADPSVSRCRPARGRASADADAGIPPVAIVPSQRPRSGAAAWEAAASRAARVLRRAADRRLQGVPRAGSPAAPRSARNTPGSAAAQRPAGTAPAPARRTAIPAPAPPHRPTGPASRGPRPRARKGPSVERC